MAVIQSFLVLERYSPGFFNAIAATVGKPTVINKLNSQMFGNPLQANDFNHSLIPSQWLVGEVLIFFKFVFYFCFYSRLYLDQSQSIELGFTFCFFFLIIVLFRTRSNYGDEENPERFSFFYCLVLAPCLFNAVFARGGMLRTFFYCILRRIIGNL